MTAVVLTGSRGRNERVDQFSDIDVELIGTRPQDLASDDEWISVVGSPMVVLPFDEVDLTTRLVVLPHGRKVDFSLWPETRIWTMVENGLNELYARGYRVLLDEARLTERLDAPTGCPSPAVRPIRTSSLGWRASSGSRRPRSPCTWHAGTCGW